MLVIIALMFIICVITDILQGRWVIPQISNETLILYGAEVNILVKIYREYYRIFTAIFLHSGLAHLFMNSLSFFLYLMPVEAKLKQEYLYLFVLIWGGMYINTLYRLGGMLSEAVYDFTG